MRTATIADAFYTPGIVPDDPADLPRYLREEFGKLSAAVQILAAGQIQRTTVAPAKPRAGMVRLADGVGWNPGLGAGVYCFDGTIWRLLG